LWYQKKSFTQHDWEKTNDFGSDTILNIPKALSRNCFSDTKGTYTRDRGGDGRKNDLIPVKVLKGGDRRRRGGHGVSHGSVDTWAWGAW